MDQFQDVTSSVLQSISTQFGDSLRGKTVLAAVSGGVDSIVLVHVLRELQESLGYVLTAVTVDHNMRTDGTSRRDALFTESFCAQISVPCTVAEIPAGRLAQVAEERNGGGEDAARFLRYQLFESAAAACNAQVVFLAHNRNDQLETLLERFLQGADVSGSRGIPRYRPPYFRPLLSVDRQSIENYARQHNLSWCTDPTNADTSYFRNRIRHVLMPLLTAEFPGWDTAALTGAEKASHESMAFESLAASCPWDQVITSVAEADLSSFLAQPLAVRTRILYNGLRCLNVRKRIPYRSICTFAETLEPVTVSGISFSVSQNRVILSEDGGTSRSLSGFCCPVSEEGTYDIPQGSVLIEQSGDGLYRARFLPTGEYSGAFTLPAVIRSACSADVIRTKDDRRKNVLKILSEWKVPAGRKYEIPVIEDSEVRGIWGRPAGFDDWFVIQRS